VPALEPRPLRAGTSDDSLQAIVRPIRKITSIIPKRFTQNLLLFVRILFDDTSTLLSLECQTHYAKPDNFSFNRLLAEQKKQVRPELSPYFTHTSGSQYRPGRRFCPPNNPGRLLLLAYLYRSAFQDGFQVLGIPLDYGFAHQVLFSPANRFLDRC